MLSAYRRSEIAWKTIATEFAAELAPLPTEQVAAAVLTFACAQRTIANLAGPASVISRPLWRLRPGAVRTMQTFEAEPVTKRQFARNEF